MKKGRVAFTLKECNLRHAFYYFKDIVLPFFLYRGKKEAKKGTLSDVLGVSSSAELDEGLCPFEPCQLLKKLDQNFWTCDSPLCRYHFFTCHQFVKPKFAAAYIIKQMLQLSMN